MFKKLVTFMLLSVISTASMKVLANVNNVAKITVTNKIGNNMKINDAAPVIRLAVNDVTQLQDIGTGNLSPRNIADKNADSDQPIVGLSKFELNKMPAQVWLILIGLFCFVMRSSRRSV